MVIQGEAGTGKTVLLQHLATVIAARHLDEEVAEAQRVDVAALAQGVPLLPIPVWVEARVLADRVRERGSAQPIVTLIAELLAPCGPVHVADVEQGLKDGRYLLLVDARDEVTADGLAALDRALVQIARTRPKTRVIVTTRPAAHTGSVLGAPFVTVNLAMLDDERRSRMVDRWCGAQRATWPERDTELREAVRLLADRLQGEAGDPLSNPLFLTCAMIRFEVDHRLPDDRADLIDRLIDMLCMSRGVADREGDSDRRRREAARAVAWALQRSGGTALGVDDAARAVQKALGLEKERDGVVALDRLAAHTMIFRFEEQAGRRVVRPWHRTFQELLAAEADLARGDGVEVVYTRWSAEGWLDDPRWEGCVRLMAGVLATRSREEAHLWVDALLGEDRADVRQRGRRLALLADAVAEERTRCWEDGDPGLGRYARAVMERYAAEGREYGWKDRLVLLEGLGRMATARSLGTRGEEGTVDPRFPDLRWDRSRWVAVEGGRYRVGDGPPREVDVGAFELLDTPVLVQDWRPFVESGAWEDPRFRLAGSPPPERVPEWVGQRRYPNRPVWGVDWYDAVAFCRWATEAWALPAGAVVALPTAVEWEVAARGRGGDRYPWGNQAEPGREEEAQACYDWGWRPFRGPAPVGVFPAGARERLLDLAGNVWEWTDSRFSEDGAGDDTRLSAPDTGVSGGDRIVSRVSPDAAPRVVRGGSWSGDARWLRAAIRSGRHPHLRNRHLGFRVCVRREPGR
jgi:formylglycine-generating enzyme required for sulfatase activity